MTAICAYLSHDQKQTIVQQASSCQGLGVDVTSTLTPTQQQAVAKQGTIFATPDILQTLQKAGISLAPRPVNATGAAIGSAISNPGSAITSALGELASATGLSALGQPNIWKGIFLLLAAGILLVGGIFIAKPHEAVLREVKQGAL